MTLRKQFPAERLRRLNDGSIDADGDYVLYWMTANRRIDWNFALERAVDLALELDRPLLILEALRVDYPWASDRFHRFVVDGMLETAARVAQTGAAYYPYLEPSPGHGRDLLAALASRAAAVVADDDPTFFYPSMLAAAGARVRVSMEAVDSAGLLPVSATDSDFPTALAFRRFLQRELPAHLARFPRPSPLDAPLAELTIPLARITDRYRPTSLAALSDPSTIAALPIDHAVRPLATAGGGRAARRRLERFVADRLESYGQERNHPDRDHTSDLSAHLHFGHISSHEVFETIAAEQLWSPTMLGHDRKGARQGWWGMSAGAEAYLDQLVTWRELGLNMCFHRPDYDRFTSLPEWALETLDAHRDDERPHLYDLAQFEAAATHDEIWNAAQRELVTRGRIHNYLRMLWGKKILEWSETPEAALATMIELNNKYALDGRDGNSYSGIFWVMGRYDHAWGPERPVFGKVRYLTSANTARKLRLSGYLETFAGLANGAGEAASCTPR